MTFAFGLAVFGLIAATAALRNASIASVLTGSIESGASAFNFRNTKGAGQEAKEKGIGSSLGSLAGAGTVTPKTSWNPNGKPVAAWIAPLLTCAAKNGWSGSVTSGYRTKAEQTRIYNSGIRPAAKPGQSNHEGAIYPRGAVDVTDHEGLKRALEKCSGGKALKWYGPGDQVHFSGTGR